MEKYLSHYSAAAFWNIPYIDTVLGFKADEPEPVTMDFTFNKRNARYFSKDSTNYLCQLTLPAGAVISRKGVKVASPELMFIQLASKLDIHRLILLGLQLCSHPPGKAGEAITSKQKLGNFIEKTHGHRGYRKACRSLQYVEDGSASIMESIAYMVLALPHALGGYGLRTPIFNYEIKLKEESGKRLEQGRCFVDLYYGSKKIAVEYDSFTYHKKPSEQGRDAVRSMALERQGIRVMSLSTLQIYDKKACMDFAYNLAHSLDKRIQIRTKKFDIMHDRLRSLLPNKSTVVE